MRTREIIRLDVVQVKRSKTGGHFELGVEMLYPARDFWGVKFPDE